jgi:hypothetical protein
MRNLEAWQFRATRMVAKGGREAAAAMGLSTTTVMKVERMETVQISESGFKEHGRRGDRALRRLSSSISVSLHCHERELMGTLLARSKLKGECYPTAPMRKDRASTSDVRRGCMQLSSGVSATENYSICPSVAQRHVPATYVWPLRHSFALLERALPRNGRLAAVCRVSSSLRCYAKLDFKRVCPSRLMAVSSNRYPVSVTLSSAPFR